MKPRIFIISFFITLTALGQSRLDSIFIKNIKVGWDNDFSTDKERKYIDIDSIKDVLNADVFGVYNLYDKYDTELKQKVFLETPEGIQLKNNVLKKRENYLKRTFMVEIHSRSNLYYDLKSKTINFNVGYIDFGYGLNITKPTPHIQLKEIFLKYKDKINSSRDFETSYTGELIFIQKISFKLLNEKIALKIEENRANVSFLLLFKATKTSPYIIKHSSVDYYSSVLEGFLSKVIVYNNLTDEIYFEN